MNNFVVIIVTHKRPNKQVSLEMLRSQGYTGKVILLVDDTDDTIEELKKNYSNTADIVIFKKTNNIDTVDNFNNLKSVVYARNEATKVAKKYGYDYFLMLDDDINSLNYRYEENNSLKGKKITNLDGMFEKILKFLDIECIKSISFGSPANYIGGLNGNFKEGICYNANQSYFMKTKDNIQFKGTLDEDIITSNLYTTTGNLFITLLAIQQNSPDRGSNDGGLKELYEKSNNYINSFYAIVCSPSNLKISKNYQLKKTNNKIVPKIISGRYKK